MADRIADAQRSDGVHRAGPLGAFALGTFHALVLVWAFVFIGFTRGSFGKTLDGLGTIAGLAAFAGIWAGVGTIGAVAVLGLQRGAATDASTLLGRGFAIGGRSGALVAAPLAALLFVGAPIVAVVDGRTAEGIGTAVAVMLLAGAALAVAALVGALLGSAFAMIDIALLGLSRFLAPDEGAPPPGR